MLPSRGRQSVRSRPCQLQLNVLERRLPGLWVSAIVAALLLLNGALLVVRGLTAREYWMWASGVVAVVLLLGPDLVG